MLIEVPERAMEREGSRSFVPRRCWCNGSTGDCGSLSSGSNPLHLPVVLLSYSHWRSVVVLARRAGVRSTRGDRHRWRFPDTSAEEFLVALREDASLLAIPVVLWTAFDLRARREEFERRFAPLAIVGKPATFTEIAAALEAPVAR